MDDRFEENFEQEDLVDLEQEDRFEIDLDLIPKAEHKFSESMIDYFAGKGFELRWVRGYLAGGIDRQNIQERRRRGWALVEPSELPKGSEFVGMPENLDSFGEVVTLGDLVLMKCPAHLAERQRQMLANHTRKQQEAHEQRLRDNRIRHEGSKTVVRSGKNAHFSGS